MHDVLSDLFVEIVAGSLLRRSAVPLLVSTTIDPAIDCDSRRSRVIVSNGRHVLICRSDIAFTPLVVNPP